MRKFDKKLSFIFQIKVTCYKRDPSFERNCKIFRIYNKDKIFFLPFQRFIRLNALSSPSVNCRRWNRQGINQTPLARTGRLPTGTTRQTLPTGTTLPTPPKSAHRSVSASPTLPTYYRSMNITNAPICPQSTSTNVYLRCYWKLLIRVLRIGSSHCSSNCVITSLIIVG